MQTLEVDLKTMDEDLLTAAGNARTFSATVSIRPGANLEVACTESGTDPQFTAGCDLNGPWSFTKPTEAWFSRRTIWVRRKAGATGVDDYASWLITISSTLAAPSSQTVTVSFKDAFTAPPDWTDLSATDGTLNLPTFSAYAGTLTIQSPAAATPYLPPSSSAPLLTIPIQATISTACGDLGACLVIRDATKVLTPDGVVVIPLVHNGVRGPAAIKWITPTAGSNVQGFITAIIKEASMRQQTGVGNLTGKLTIAARIDASFPNDYRDDFDTGNPNQYEAFYNLQRLTQNTTCSTSNPCSAGNTCLNGFCISEFRTNLANFCDDTRPCPNSGTCVVGFCAAQSPEYVAGDFGLSNTNADQWAVHYGDMLSSLARPTEVSPTGQFQSNWFDDPYSPSGMNNKLLIGAALYPELAKIGGLDPGMCHDGFGAFVDSLSLYASDHGPALPFIEGPGCNGLSCLCDQTSPTNLSPPDVPLGSIACVDPFPSQGTTNHLLEFTGKTADCYFIWEQIRSAEDPTGATLSSDFHASSTTVNGEAAGCVRDPHGTQLVYRENGTFDEAHDIWFCRGWADAVSQANSPTRLHRELSYNYNTSLLPLQTPGLALEPFLSASACSQDLFGVSSGDPFICQGSAVMQGVPLLSHLDDVAKGSQKNAFDLLSSCVSDLKAPPPFVSFAGFGVRNDAVSSALQTFFTSRTCFDPARYYTTQATPGPSDDPRFKMRLLQEWAELHTFVANESVQVQQLARTQAGATLPGDLPTISGVSSSSDVTQPPATAEEVLQRMEEAWAYVIALAKNDRAFNLATGDVRSPDYRPVGVRTDPGNRPFFPSPPQADANYEQPYGPAPALMEALTAHMKLLTDYLETVANKAYGATGSTSGGTTSDALGRFGSAMRFALAIEEISTRIHQRAFANPPSCTTQNVQVACAEFDPPSCSAEADGQTGTCLPSAWSARWDTARAAYFAARSGAVRAAVGLSRGRNPLGIDDDDLPLFFGDLTGTNSRFFASSDYLINTWAVSAVSSARGALNDARDAWIKRRDSKIADETAANDKDRRVEALQTEYGSSIAQACGLPDDVGVTDILQQAMDGQISLEDCYLDLSRDECKHDQAQGGGDAEAAARNLAIETCTTQLNANAAVVDQASSNLCTKLFTEQHPTSQQGIVTRVGKRTYTKDDNTECDVGGIPYWDTKKNQWVSCDSVRISHDFWGGTPHLHGQGVSMEPCSLEKFEQDKLTALQLGGPSGEEAAKYCEAHVNATMFRDLSVSPRPGSCYRGDLGTSTLKAVRAKQDVEDAVIGLQDLVSSYELEIKRCNRLQADATIVEDYDTQFNDLMVVLEEILRSIQAAKDQYDLFSSFSLDLVHDVEAAGNYIFGNSTQADSDVHAAADQITDANRKHDAFLRKVQEDESVYNCAINAEKIWLGFDAARGTVVRRSTDLNGARVELDAVLTKAKRAILDGAQALKHEEDRTTDSYGFHYWFDERVSRFKREFAWAKRLVYLSLRAVEYEFQQSLPLRNEVLTAEHPDQLEAALEEMETELATRTIGRRRPEQESVVLSLRDDVLGVPDRTNASNGERAMSASLAFRSRLWDEKFAVRDTNGRWVGQGIPFTLTPQGALANRCAERLWRVTATIQGDGLSDTQPGASVILLQRNTFGSQWCQDRGAGSDATLQLGSVQPSRNLFRENQGTVDEETRALTAASLYPWFNVRRSDFYKASYQDGASEELAGRGLYSDYILLFPRELIEGSSGPPEPASGDPGAGKRVEKFPLSHVEDVLLRFDFLSVDNLSSVAQ